MDSSTILAMPRRKVSLYFMLLRGMNERGCLPTVCIFVKELYQCWCCVQISLYFFWLFNSLGPIAPKGAIARLIR